MDFRVILTFSICIFSIFLDFVHSAADLPRKGSVLELTTGVSSASLDPTKVIQISWHPRAFVYKGFLTDEECDHLINLAKDKLEKSLVADNESGRSVESDARTSSGMFLKKAQDKIVADIEARIAAWTFFLEDNGEAIQVLRYEYGQKYEPHYDYFNDMVNQRYGGQRVATMLMYLSNVKKGGETVFPNSDNNTQSKDDSWSECGKRGIAVKPKKGDALLFFDFQLNGSTDRHSLHAGCPIIEGEKWSATEWIHIRSFEKLDCFDEHKKCAVWAAAGE